MDTLPRRDALLLLAVLGAGVFLAGLELMITAVALPAIVIDLADWTRLREASWIINGYLLVYVVTMPLAGRLADLWGNRRMFLSALVLFTVGSLLAGLAPSLELLVAARLVQAAGRGPQARSRR
jgi:MFS family permease